MKPLVLVLLLCCSMGALAQNWAPFPLHESANWQIDYAWLDGGSCLHEHEVVYFVDGDTLISNNLYAEIDFYGYKWTESIWGGSCGLSPTYFAGNVGLFRAEEGKIFRASSVGDELMYDFTLGIGDTLESVLNDYFPLIVEDKDSLLVDGVYRKRLWLDTPENIWILEGIGSALGFDQRLTQFENWSTLNCYSHYGIPQLGSGTFCNLINEIETQETESLISPNPTTGIFQLLTPRNSSYRVYDLFGRIIKKGETGASQTIDLTAQPIGIYLISIESEKGISIAKLLKQ
ncbi:MAG: T9SS type A sorting domain-containing protein [Flavobacteriales bacterium]|nr:T9SS type A sorting domain-containing protein [Flavobacteriales bacterium]